MKSTQLYEVPVSSDVNPSSSGLLPADVTAFSSNRGKYQIHLGDSYLGVAIPHGVNITLRQRIALSSVGHQYTMRLQNRSRPWFRFRLRTLLIVVAVLATPFGWRAERIRSERATIAWVEEMGGLVVYEKRRNTSWWEKATNMWLGNKKAEQAYLHYTSVTDVFPLAGLQDLKKISITSTSVSDVSSLTEMKNLENIILNVTQVSTEQVQQLRQALPSCKISHSSEVPSMLENMFEDLIFRLEN